MKYRHYAPKASLTIVEGEQEKVTAKINELLKEGEAAGESRNLLFRIASAIGPLQVSLLLTKISLSYFFIGYTSIT